MDETTTAAHQSREKMAEPRKIRFPVPVLDKLQSIADARGSSVNEVVRRYVDDGLERERNGTGT